MMLFKYAEYTESNCRIVMHNEMERMLKKSWPIFSLRYYHICTRFSWG